MRYSDLDADQVPERRPLAEEDRHLEKGIAQGMVV